MARLPIAAYGEREWFKLYMLDVGLLSAMCNLDIRAFYGANNSVFTDFKGAITEQFVLQELKASGEKSIWYWVNGGGAAEIDFLIQYKNSIVPIEVKSSANKSAASLRVYVEKNKPDYIIKTSLDNYGKYSNLFTIPLYMFYAFKSILQDEDGQLELFGDQKWK